MSDLILALNAGSSSIKFALAAIDGGALGDIRLHGALEGLHTAPHLRILDGAGETVEERRWSSGTDHDVLLDPLLGQIDAHVAPGRRLRAIGHRIVHGGAEFDASVRIDPDILARIEALTPLAPLHQPLSVAPIHAIGRLRPGLPQIACFDTAFHHTLPPVAHRYALPRHYEARRIRRFGFHGLSYTHIAEVLRRDAPALAAGRVIAAHLGNGASLCALRGGESIDTTMGMTALDGLVMGTRCGALDPGVLLYLQQQDTLSAAALEDMLYHRSGLLGVSELSSDMRDLLASDTPAAADAVELFVYRAAREAGGLVASLGGLDGLVFSGGIGEHMAVIRARICARLGCFGVRLDADANTRGAPVISAPDSAVSVRIVPADEEAVILRDTAALLG